MTKEKKLKLIWDFRGPDAATTAQHHARHLKEYLTTNKLSLEDPGFEKLSDMHSISFLVVPESAMAQVRDDLRPHRAQLFVADM